MQSDDNTSHNPLNTELEKNLRHHVKQEGEKKGSEAMKTAQHRKKTVK
jgi:hypothetical protein